MIVWISNKNKLNSFRGNQVLADTFFDVCVLATEPLPEDHNSQAHNVIDCRINKFTGYVKRHSNNDTLCEELAILKKEIQKALEDSHEKGKKEGQNLLMQLNKGEISIKDIEV